MTNDLSTIRKSNWLITASYKLTLNEKRLVLLAVSKIPFDANGDQRRVEISAEEMLTIFPDIGERNVHKEMRDAVKRLWEREIIIDQPLKKTEKFRWISAQTVYHDGEGRVGFSFSPEVLPYLQQLKSQFTKYSIGEISNLKSVYSIRLYEMLMQFQNTGIVAISVQDFKERLGISDKYADYLNLRRVVIEHAVKELEEKSCLNVSFKAEKKGKSISNLIFLFSVKK